ncbi:MAG: ligand-binding sensor domain-containing protein [Flavobacteriales bacterium]
MKRCYLLPLLWCSTVLCTSITAQQWTVYDMENSPLPSTNVKALVEDGEGGLWIGTDWGLCHFDGSSEWAVFQEGTSPLVENDIRSLQMDPDGRLWIGTVSMGLQVKDGDDWTTYTPLNSPLPEYGIRDLDIDASGTVWICTASGLARFDGTEWSLYNNTAESHLGAVLATANTNTVAVNNDGTICLGTFNGGLHFIQGSSVEVLTSFDDGFFDNTAVDVLFHPITGARWVATPAAGLLRQQGPVIGGLWTQWSGATGFPSNATTALAVDITGDVWVGTQIAGLVSVKPDGTFEQYNDVNSGLQDNTIRSLLASTDGAVWVGTFLGGLARFDPTVSMEESVPTARIRAYPNPVSDRFEVSCVGGCSGAHWALVASDGSRVREGRSTTDALWIDASGLAPGPYALQWAGRGSVAAIRVLVY